MIIYLLPTFICSCGYAVELLPLSMGSALNIEGRLVSCTNPACPHFKKKFKLPSLKLEEVPSGQTYCRAKKTHTE